MSFLTLSATITTVDRKKEQTLSWTGNGNIPESPGFISEMNHVMVAPAPTTWHQVHHSKDKNKNYYLSIYL